MDISICPGWHLFCPGWKRITLHCILILFTIVEYFFPFPCFVLIWVANICHLRRLCQPLRLLILVKCADPPVYSTHPLYSGLESMRQNFWVQMDPQGCWGVLIHRSMSRFRVQTLRIVALVFSSAMLHLCIERSGRLELVFPCLAKRL